MATYPTLKYDQSSAITYDVRTIESNFGDGYQEVTPDGINHIVRSGTIVHKYLSKAEADTLRAFLFANAGSSTTVTILNLFEDNTGATTLEVYLNKNWNQSTIGNVLNFSIPFRQAFN